MIDYDDSDRNILQYYNMSSLNKVTKESLNLLNQEYFEASDVNQLSKEEQYELLTKLVNNSTGGKSKYDHSSEILEDPLHGSGTNVPEQLLRQGVIDSMDDAYLSQYLISSQQFNSKQFLTTVHKDTSIDELTRSLEFLERNIHNQTEQLKSVMDDNFINFVNCKKSIDDVLTEFKQQKTVAQTERENSKVFNPQRHRNLSHRQESLISDLEESVKNLNMASTLRIRPIVENKNIETKVSKFLEFVKKNSFFFDLPNKLLEYAAEQDHDMLIETYQKYLEEKNNLLSYHLTKYKKELSKPDQEKDQQLINTLEQEQRMINTSLAKLFIEVDQITVNYRKKTYDELLSIDYEMDNAKRPLENANFSKFLNLLQKLDQLDQFNSGKSNHVYDFLDLQLDNLSQDFDYQLARFESKFTLVQTKLYDYINSLHSQRKNGSEIRFIREKYNDMEEYFKAAVSSTLPTVQERERIIMEIFDTSDNMDLSIINETWLVLNNFISYLSEIFHKNLNKFINNYYYYNDPKNNLAIDSDGTLGDKFFDLVERISGILIQVFSNDSGEVNQLESSPVNYSQFLPYHTNSLSAVAYLNDINFKLNNFLTIVGSHVGTVGNLSKSTNTNKMVKNLRACSSKINQKIIEAVCAVWVNDCSQFYDLETWEIYNSDIIVQEDSMKQSTFTKAMKIIECYEIYMLKKISNLVFQKVPSEEDSVRIVSSYPNKRILVSLEIQFMRSLNILNESVMKRYNVERNDSDFNDEFELYKILTMNNFDQLSRDIFPLLINVFDREFDKKLSEQNLKIFKDIDKVNETVFQDILIIEKLWINNVVSTFFAKAPVNRSTGIMKIDGVIYEVLMHFVKLIHVVKPLTSLEIFIEILNELQEAFLRDFLSNLRNLNNVVNDWFSIFKLDINFFLEIFEASRYLKLNERSLNIVNLILQEINANEEPNYTEQEFEHILSQNLKDSENQFDSFL